MDSQIKTTNQQQTQENQSVASVQPVGSVHKEQGIAGVSEKSEFIRPSALETGPVLSPEEKEAGVGKINPPEDQYRVDRVGTGLTRVTPVSLQPDGTVVFPMTEKEALRTIKTTSLDDSRHWLAVLIEKIFQRLKAMGKNIVTN